MTIETEDVVERLRATSVIQRERDDGYPFQERIEPSPSMLEAADTIERLREENARLRDELLWYATKLPHADYRHHAQRALGL